MHQAGIVTAARSSDNAKAVFDDFGLGIAALAILYPEDASSLQKISANTGGHIKRLLASNRPVHVAVGGINFYATKLVDGPNINFTVQVSKQIKK